MTFKQIANILNDGIAIALEECNKNVDIDSISPMYNEIVMKCVDIYNSLNAFYKLCFDTEDHSLRIYEVEPSFAYINYDESDYE